jgi:hypothetical protein
MSIVALTSDTLVASPGAGQIEYNGQFYGTDSNASRAQMQRLVLATSQASTSGTSIDFTGIPSWVKRITVMFAGVSTNGTSNLLVQIGTSSGVEITGYTAAATRFGSTTLASASFTNGFGLNLSAAAETYSGSMIISNFTSNTWVAQGCFAVAAAGTVTFLNAGVKSLSAVLDRVRITSATPDTFDAGSINILYEG